MPNCTVTLKIIDGRGQDVSGVGVSVSRVVVNGTPNSSYVADYTTDSEGVATLTVPQGSTTSLECTSSVGLTNFRFVAPKTGEYFLGVFTVDSATVNNPYIPGLKVYRALLTQLN